MRGRLTLDSAVSSYQEGDYRSALQAALAALQGGDAGAALLIAAKSLVAMGELAGLGRIIEVASQNGAPPERTFFRIAHDCLMDGHYRPLITLEHGIPEASLLHPIALYYASCARMMLGEEAEAAHGFDRFRRAMPRYLQALPVGTDDGFNLMFRQGTLVLAPDRVPERLAQGAAMPAAQQAIEIVRPVPTDVPGPILMCCADARYVAYFLERWLAPLATLGWPIHVHAVNPTPDTLPLIERLGHATGLADRLGSSISTDPLGTATSYACARFETVPVLLEAYRRPLLALDIDVAAMPALAELAAIPAESQFACFETGRAEPASVHQASLMMFAPGSAGFARDLAAFCRPRLNQPVRINWMLDQAALYSVLRLYRRTQPDFRYLALDRRLGRPMTDYLQNLASDEEKHAIKVKSAGVGEGADSTGKVEFTWEP